MSRPGHLNRIDAQLKQAVANMTHNQISDSARLDAELLMAFCLNQTRTYLYTWPEKRLTQTQQACFNRLIEQRLLGHPIAHLTGEREFWGLNLTVTPDTLIPRPDTERLIEAALTVLPTADHGHHLQPPNQANQTVKPLEPVCAILDLGTGTGAIALALKSERPDSHVTATDVSTLALKVARVNAQRHQLDVTFVQSDWFDGLAPETHYDLIVSNPPYIESNDPHLQLGDVRFEPLSALTAGQDGLNDLRKIIKQACSFLKKGGWLMVEHGYNQANLITDLFAFYGYQAICTLNDYGQNPRVTLGQKPQGK